MAKYAFTKAWDQVPRGKLSETKQAIKTALNIKSDPQFYNRMRGVPEPTISEAEALTKIFNGLGITKIWDGDGETL